MDKQVLFYHLFYILETNRTFQRKIEVGGNCRVHWIKTEWHDEHSRPLSHLNWRAKSPGQNPLENVWNRLKQWAKSPSQTLDNLIKLCNLLEREGITIDDAILDLVESMPCRIAALVQVRGSDTHLTALWLQGPNFLSSGIIIC